MQTKKCESCFIFHTIFALKQLNYALSQVLITKASKSTVVQLFLEDKIKQYFVIVGVKL